MQSNVQAETIYFCGQEITIHSATSRISKDDGAISRDLIRLAVSEVINLPLLIPGERDYARMIQQVIKNRVDRRLPIEVELG